MSGAHSRLNPLRWRTMLARRLTTRRCRDWNCQVDLGYHSHHLTRYGHWVFRDRFL